jgi:hypothetical protein
LVSIVGGATAGVVASAVDVVVWYMLVGDDVPVGVVGISIPSVLLLLGLPGEENADVVDPL